MDVVDLSLMSVGVVQLLSGEPSVAWVPVLASRAHCLFASQLIEATFTQSPDTRLLCVVCNCSSLVASSLTDQW